MKIEIETYKDQTIYYDDELDKFVCDIDIEDKTKSTKRASLKDVRKEIDQFIKANLNFKPFKVLERGTYEGFKELEFTALRTDGKLVGKGGVSWKTHYGATDVSNVCKYDPTALLKLQEIEEDYQEYRKQYQEKIKTLSESLVPLDLTKYNLVYLNA